MKCSDLTDMISAYADGELPQTQREFIEEHLTGCPRCRETLAGFVSVRHKLGLLEDIKVPQELAGDITDEIENIKQSGQNGMLSWGRVLGWAGIALVAALLLFAWPWGSDMPGDSMMYLGDGELRHEYGLSASPPLSEGIIGGIYVLSLAGGLVYTLFAVLKNGLARKTGGYAAAMLGIAGMYYGLYGQLADQSDYWLAVGVLPVFGIVSALRAIRTGGKPLWSGVTGLVLCLAAAGVYCIYTAAGINHDYWWTFTAAAVGIPMGILAWSFRDRFKLWWRPAAVGISAIILVLAGVLQAWSGNPLSPQAVIARASEYGTEIVSYRFEYSSWETVDGNEIETVIHGEFSCPDRFRLEITGGGWEREYIKIGEDEYLREAGVPGPGKTAVIFSSAYIPHKDATIEMLEHLNDVSALPDEKLDGTDCYRFRGTFPDADPVWQYLEGQRENGELEEEQYQRLLESYGGGPPVSVADFWIGKDDFLVRKLHWETWNHTGELSSRITLSYRDFNDDLHIEHPLDEKGEPLPGWAVQ